MTERVERLTAALADHDLIEPRFANGRECRRSVRLAGPGRGR